MSLRSLGSVLTRRFYPRKIYSLQAGFLPGIVSQAASLPAAGRPGRSLHSLRDLSAGENAYGALFATAFAGGLGILIFKKHPDNQVGPDVTDNKPMQVAINSEAEQEQALDRMMEKVWMIMKENKEKEKGGSAGANKE